MSADYVSTDRYGGGPYPNPATVCLGQCEGMGVYPQHGDDAQATTEEQEAWKIEHARAHTYRFQFTQLWKHRELWFWRSVIADMLKGLPCDGCHFIRCASCNGTGKRHPLQYSRRY